MILAIRTDKPEAEINIFAADGAPLGAHTWHAHRELADTLLTQLRNLLASQQATFADITGVVVFRGPGSFTGLRIGITVANALAYGQSVPIVGALGDDWLKQGLAQLAAGQNDKIILPEYGAEAHITMQKK
jgi:tRNA threonylcarbamoyladenosine biosynthesis protein TsaB